MDIKILAFILLIGRLVALGFNIAVLRRQLKLRGKKSLPIIHKYRQVFFTLNMAILALHIYPLGLDILTLFVDTGRNPTASLVGVFYSLDANIGFLIASVLIYALYKISDEILEIAQIYEGEKTEEA